MKSLQTTYINKDNAVLAVVDVENEFCKPGGKMYSDFSAGIMPSVISNIKKLIEKARRAEVPIVYIQSMRTHREPEYSVFKLRPILKKGTWASEIIDEIKPQEGDIIIPKFCHDPFFRPDFDKVLRKLVPDPTRCYAVVVGGAANICVYHTVMGFHLRHYWVVVPEDSLFYLSDAGYQRALEQFSESGAYANVFLSRSDLIKVSSQASLLNKRPVPGS